MIRLASSHDLDRFRQIHQEFYQKEFDYPNWNDFIDVLVSNDISIGGIRPILEVVAVTDKSVGYKARRQALLHLLTAVSFTARRKGFDQIHAFVQDRKWKEHLKKYDFRECKGEALVLDV